MRLSDYIESDVETILVAWDVFARSIGAGAELDSLTLRDHAREILLAIVADMRSDQSSVEQSEKGKGHRLGHEGSAALDTASEAHAIGRLGSGFDLLEVVAEYRALRASVLSLWHDSLHQADTRDVIDITRFNEALDQLVTKAVRSYTKRVDQARDMFLAILSHDLRNPLNSIAVSAQLLPLLDADSDDARESSEQIAASVRVMARMIGDLLDYTRTRLGTGMPVTPLPMDLEHLGLNVFKEFRSAHLDRVVTYQTEGDLKGLWDADRLRQAVSNLLGNAMQHGAADEPVELAVRDVGDDVVITVHNGGDPIPPGELAKIFDPLIRGSSGDSPRKSRPGSIGLGLYIAREVAKSHGGRIDVASTRDAGTTFTMRLPRQPAFRTAAPPVMDESQIQAM